MNNLSVVFIAILPCLLGSCEPPENSHVGSTPAAYLLSESELPGYESEIDHAKYVSNLADWEEDWEMRNRGITIYRSTCYSCHGNNEQPGTLPDSKKFWEEAFGNGNDPYTMYQSITRGFGLMPPQPQLAPSQKYDVIAFIREELIKPHNPSQYFEVNDAYLATLPVGDNLGPDPKPYHPWSDLDYGNWLIHCYEMSDSDDPPKIISGGKAPLVNEDYAQVNFAYKGIAMRLDPGEGGVAAGNTFALFDHDLLRFVGAWTGEGFIDWEDILLDDQHNVYPRTVGKRQFANAITPGWADPATGSFEDPRIRGLDGRPFGPLPRAWAHYKGLYRYEDRVVIKYTVGEALVLETYDLIRAGEMPTISRTINISGADNSLKLRVAPAGVSVAVKGEGVSMGSEGGYKVLTTSSGPSSKITIFLSRGKQQEVDAVRDQAEAPMSLDQFTQGSEKKYTEALTSPIISGNEEDPYAVDVLVLPQVNPWKSRVRLTGIDFLQDGNEAVVCTIDGEVWRIEGISSASGPTKWYRIATGMFQPLGIKVQNGNIYVGCRDQIVILRDLNGDGETDFYESFNSDHQVTEHFHEFAMGLQTDDSGNFYYAKSGRHARTSLVPQHGTLIKVSPDG
ncbi:MAG: cytochrome c, partial [Saprospiraceae bacterium]|nr:cytochrome c [Saprospiraceae bacterium]